MIRRKFSIYLLVAAILPALMVTIPASDAQARSRTGAFVTGLVIGAAGAAALYHHSNKRWNRVLTTIIATSEGDATRITACAIATVPANIVHRGPIPGARNPGRGHGIAIVPTNIGRSIHALAITPLIVVTSGSAVKQKRG